MYSRCLMLSSSRVPANCKPGMKSEVYNCLFHMKLTNRVQPWSSYVISMAQWQMFGMTLCDRCDTVTCVWYNTMTIVWGVTLCDRCDTVTGVTYDTMTIVWCDTMWQVCGMTRCDSCVVWQVWQCITGVWCDTVTGVTRVRRHTISICSSSVTTAVSTNISVALILLCYECQRKPSCRAGKRVTLAECCWLFICSMLCSIWHVHTCPDSVCSTPGCRHLQLANQCQLVFFHVVLAVGSWLGWCCSKILSLSQLQIWNFQQATSASSVWISGRMCGTETPCYLSHCWYCYTQKTLLPVWLSTSE